MQAQQIPSWVKFAHTVLNPLVQTSWGQNVAGMGDNHGNASLAIRELACVVNEYSKGEKADPESLDKYIGQCRIRWIQVKNDSLGSLGPNPFLRLGCLALFSATAWSSPRILLGSATVGLLLSKKSELFQEGIQRNTMEWIGNNQAAFSTWAVLAGGSLIAWEVSGVGLLASPVHMVFSTATATFTGAAAGMYLADRNVI